ncbi:succinyl-diaminopimelate desuccinylase [Pleionea mediterranea]|uniref:Succinyl-diaminopimelate desuccinylase n=1 Tax=Pleionea mediterranea TaxID=523701 RepID=A0A316G3E3_9GAMM|nr:succinyl-diaminopimelate desuccinylase [Pleionea mediterranea]PWK54300.1 succinyldiaminopimelate desuccinylase [Pleionea mediterranea]
MASTLELAKELIRRPSVTPDDKECQQLMIDWLKPLGFDCEKMDFNDTENLWAIRGNAAPVFVFAGHTDVVPPGPLGKWQFDPFTPTEHNGYLYGRGAADMKGSLAAMLTATKRFVDQHPTHKGSIGFLITSDEEGPFINGTVRVVEQLMQRQQPIHYALVGEPSSGKTLGDVIKNGRRGSLTGWLKVQGTQGHVAYPHLAKNAVHVSLTALSDLSNKLWDNGNAFFPPTSFQITNVEAGTGAGNIIPGELALEFNFRYSTEQTADSLKQQVEAILNQYELDYQLNWKLNGEPFITQKGELLDACQKAIKQELNIDTRAETSGGTSDGRFIAKTGAQVVELGPVNATIHKVDECVSIKDLEALSRLYQRILENTLL